MWTLEISMVGYILCPAVKVLKWTIFRYSSSGFFTEAEEVGAILRIYNEVIELFFPIIPTFLFCMS